MARFSPTDSDLSEYALVADRLTLFYQRYPFGRIVTRLYSRTEHEITFRALVFRGAEDAEPAATGWASERIGDGEINEVACLENTETSAIGRALANLGFTASRRRPSREEMEKAARARASAPKQRVAAVAEPAPTRAPLDADPLQQRANAVHDVLELLDRAEAVGFPSKRAATLRRSVVSPDLVPSRVTRLERRLRGWVARRRRLVR